MGKPKIGEWVRDHATLRRDDGNGMVWAIDFAPLKDGRPSGGFTLSCTYREHRGSSWHPTLDSAKEHRDDLVRSWEARTLRAYHGDDDPPQHEAPVHNLDAQLGMT